MHLPGALGNAGEVTGMANRPALLLHLLYSHSFIALDHIDCGLFIDSVFHDALSVHCWQILLVCALSIERRYTYVLKPSPR